MQERAIDFEKDYLVIYRDINGHFANYRWFQNEKTPEQMQSIITNWNRKQSIESADFRQAELITDKLVREICAYKIQAAPLEDIIREVKELQENISAMKTNLNYALDALERIGEEELNMTNLLMLKGVLPLN